jgi:putative CocE/NonD family hydrolase
MRRARAAVLVVLALLAALLAPAGPSSAGSPPPLTPGPYRAGYVTMADGTKLRYTVFLPAATGRFPTVMQYDGYAAGTNPFENGQDSFGARMLARGYAVLGVNVRGTGCSSGTFDMFVDQWATDGYDAVEWAASQPWSDGHVGMFGVSMPAIMSLYVAAKRPPHLDAVAPGSALSDLYRDVAYPGGIYNQSFAAFWTAGQKLGYQDTPLVPVNDGDADCLGHTAQQNAPDKVVIAQGQTHPYDDAFWRARSLGARLADVTAPVLSLTAWQDEQVSGRYTTALRSLDIATSWHVVTNGNHGTSITAAAFGDLQEAFFDHFVAGAANGFETSTPHVQVWHELEAATYTPRWVTSYADWPTPTTLTYNLTADSRLTTAAATASGAASFAYPAPSAPMASEGNDQPSEQTAYKAPGFGVAFTTDAFANDVEVFGPASADVWLASTATDTDVQVTLSEIRPDGQELFVQRGWLRASHRALDAARSTATRPYQTHAASGAAPLTPNVATLLRVEVFPVGHVFRAGSRLRLRVEAPASVTGMRALQFLPVPAVNTVRTGPSTPSRLVLGTVPATGVVAAYPACDGLVNQPCRTP